MTKEEEIIMATHNQVRLVGYLLKDPKIINEGQEGAEQILFQLRTVRRKIEGNREDPYADVIVYYDDTSRGSLMNKLKDLHKFDIVDIKGVFNILPVHKKSKCSICGHINVKYQATSTVVYPINLTRIGSYLGYYDEKGESPDSILMKNYKEISNQCIIFGTVVSSPELINDRSGNTCCRYELGVNRKYYIRTQDDKHADYPWVYSYGKQADRDSKYLTRQSEIFIDAFIHNERIMTKHTCENCNSVYSYPDIGTQFTPYSVEYVSNYKTDADLEREAENARRRRIHGELEDEE